MFRNTVLLVCGVFLSLVLSCKKEKVPCTGCGTTGTTNCEDIQNVKKFFAFKVGSWWLYEEENSGMRDSVYVTQYANDPTNYNFDVRMYSTHQDYFYHFWPIFASGDQSCKQSGLICNRCITIERSKYNQSDFVGSSFCFFFINRLDQFIYTYSNSVSNNRIQISLKEKNYTVGVYDFKNVTGVYEISTHIENEQPTYHFYAENVGLIRKELLDSNQVWNLIDYHIQE